jgi:hypothetical protein
LIVEPSPIRKIIANMPPFAIVALPIAQGFVFAAIRSGVGIGVEVNSSGGSLGGNTVSRMVS